MSHNNTQPFEQACEYLSGQDDFYKETTGFLPTFNHQKKAYRYFFTKHNTKEMGNINWLTHPLEDTQELEGLDTIYLLEISNELDEDTKNALEADFEKIEDVNELGISKWTRVVKD